MHFIIKLWIHKLTCQSVTESFQTSRCFCQLLLMYQISSLSRWCKIIHSSTWFKNVDGIRKYLAVWFHIDDLFQFSHKFLKLVRLHAYIFLLLTIFSHWFLTILNKDGQVFILLSFPIGTFLLLPFLGKETCRFHTKIYWNCKSSRLQQPTFSPCYQSIA